jgi:hypothetical protein
MATVTPNSRESLPASGEVIDLHELAKGWKAAIARAKDPATKYVNDERVTMSVVVVALSLTHFRF